jgi:hypothetical protein
MPPRETGRNVWRMPNAIVAVGCWGRQSRPDAGIGIASGQRPDRVRIAPWREGARADSRQVPSMSP